MQLFRNCALQMLPVKSKAANKLRYFIIIIFRTLVQFKGMVELITVSCSIRIF